MLLLTALRDWSNQVWHISPEKRRGIQDVVQKTWFLGFTSFGGTAVQFRMLHREFVEKHEWIDERLYQELFAFFQALPGSASTKMIVCFNWIHGGFRAAMLSFAMWCAPSAIGMYGLALGISRIGNSLPGPVYAFLTGLNSATVGIIALAAVQLSGRAITDPLTRLLVFFGAIAGMLYSALWYFPIILVCAGSATVVWDYKWLQKLARLSKRCLSRRTFRKGTRETSHACCGIDLERQDTNQTIANSVSMTLESNESLKIHEPPSIPSVHINLLSWRRGAFICLTFLISFILLLILRSAIHHPSRSFSLLSNFYLAGTIIFGGGPVVIPLLREYIVEPGLVSSRDFLLGVALIEAFPGPNFNIAVYLGALAVRDTSIPSYVGALIGFIGMFLPGMWLAIGSMGVWAKLRDKKWLKSCLRGVHAAAVGLVFTAVYRLWRVGLLDQNNQYGTELGNEPWWLAVSATAFVGGAWFRLEAPFAIALGGIMGLVWYGVVNK